MTKAAPYSTHKKYYKDDHKAYTCYVMYPPVFYLGPFIVNFFIQLFQAPYQHHKKQYKIPVGNKEMKEKCSYVLFVLKLRKDAKRCPGQCNAVVNKVDDVRGNGRCIYYNKQ